MSDYEFPVVPELEKALRTAHRALESIAVRGLFAPEEDLQGISEVVAQFSTMVDNAEDAIAAQIGPRVHWRAPFGDGWDLLVTGVDLDGGALDFGEAKLNESAFEGPQGDWIDSPLNRAARGYKREAGWDFAPDETGIWVLMLAPVSKVGGDGDDEDSHQSGHLIGFVVVQDRDEDGSYESIAHIWTASAWRRRGIARRLLSEASSRFPIAGIEGPYSDDGAAFLASVPDVPPET
jgi:ribosomal protein S18 acetylase RimI-like enzyme